ncbi:MAG: hypothetical protein EXR11_13765 [Rhodospirillaceae bacterium]|nr:hypothetical protein [Rhodospirillaceae bacterium]
MFKLDRRSLFMATVAAAAEGSSTMTSPAMAQDKAKGMEMPKERKLGPGKTSPYVRNMRGKILYFGDDDKERGREWFSFSFREDGQITLRAYCEIDDARVERDVTYTMKKDFTPLDCFVRLHVGGKFLGTGWIRVTDTEAECEVFNTTFGRIQQKVALTVPPRTMGSHPLACDALVLPAFDHAKPERVQTREGALSTSPLLDGASGPLIGMSSGTIEYVGPEKITTVAGTFDAHHYRFPSIQGTALHPSGNARSEDIWVTHPDYTFVRAEVRGYLRNKTGFGRYELVEFES